jgi:hypothetical protein
MVDRDTNSKHLADAYLEGTIQVLKENDEFLRTQAARVNFEIIELINDAIDSLGLVVEPEKEGALHTDRCMGFFCLNILMPVSYALYLDLRSGNLPVCFSQLRLLLESLAKCYMADLTFGDVSFFPTRLELLRERKPNISKLMEEVGDKLGVGDRFVALWRELSEDWVHTKGIADKILDHLAERKGVPAWSLVIPMNYDKSDFPVIDELRARISQFRHLLNIAMEKYREEQGLAHKS